MNHYNEIIDWHPKFGKYKTTNQGLVLISEKENYFLDPVRYHHLIEGVDGKTTANHLATQTSDFRQGAMIYQDIFQFLEQGLISVSQVVPTYQLPTPTKDIPPKNDYNNVGVYNLSAHISSAYVHTWLSELEVVEPLNLVVADDYLDPRLIQINQESLGNNIPLLVIKPLGESWLVVFLSLATCTPCFECLTSQMLRNQPVRHWLQNKQTDDSYLTLPLLINGHTEAVKQMPSFIKKAMKHPAVLFEVNPLTLDAKQHIVNHRPQCQACGNPDLLKQQLQQAIVLRANKGKINNDGGSRMRSATDTVAKLRDWVSPLTGVITDLTSLTPPADSPIVIYRTAFFTTPPAHHSLKGDSFVQISLGKGIDPVQSQASALCESIERYAAQYQGDELWQKTTSETLDARCYTPSQLVQFSERQYQTFSQSDDTIEKNKFATKPHAPNVLLRWVPTWSITHQEKVYIPFNYGFANTPFEHDAQYIDWNSNGCAAGNTVEEAILQGLFELIERDATAIWWYNKVKTQAIDLKDLPQAHYQKFEHTLQDWHYWVLDITTDLGIPVMAGIAQHKNTGKFCLGFGAHLNATIACQRALTELCQLIPIREQNAAPFDFDAIQADDFLMPQGKPKALDSFAKQETADIAEDVLHVVQKLKAQKLETLVLNYSRPDLPVKTVKVIVPGLCHIWAQFGAQRLYKVPVAMGWTTEAKTEEELNPHLLYI